MPSDPAIPPGQPIVTVLGSVNMDLVIRCQRLPAPGQTVMARSMIEVPGGKGANQAVAAVRSGGNVRMIGRVGDDGFAPKLMQTLIDESVDCRRLLVSANCESGLALVGVEDSGENSIIIVPGANARVTAQDVLESNELIQTSAVLMAQLETPTEAVIAGIRIARQAGVKVMLDPAPASEVLPRELFDVDLICPNETEATTIVGGTLETIDDAVVVAKKLHALGPRAVAITLGARGTLLYNGSTSELIESIPIKCVDTTAAGDAFAGALAVRWAETGDLVQSIRWANVAGALATSSLGAQPSLPTRSQIDTAMGVSPWVTSSDRPEADTTSAGGVSHRKE
ncbi:ribokinase [Stieleria sp. TO1_6]|uniref:ribokinase n=1 Tax=Stieleria tagensis TaxID=2956795 RepID=UPI00209AB4AB|nr:ribokinase [Stieleria tagensis]MCO8123635.1 ribokinase [Stieleria tagensis]